jgi:hypothetical protein
MKRNKTKAPAKGLAKTPVRKPNSVASPEAQGNGPSKKSPEKRDEKEDRTSEIPGATSGVPITNQDAQETITNQSGGQEVSPDTKSKREEHQGERMGPAYIDDDSEVLRDESEKITPEK